MPRPMTDILIKQVLHRSAEAHGIRLSLGAGCCEGCASTDGAAELRLTGEFSAAFVLRSGETVIATPLSFALANGRRGEAARAAMSDVAGALRLEISATANGGLLLGPRP